MKKNAQPRIRALVYLVVFLLTLQPVSANVVRLSPLPETTQSKITVVGIFAFQDETDSGAPTELGRKIAQLLKQRLSVNFNDIVPKSLGGPSATDTPLSIEQAVAIGKQNAVQFVVRGGLLALSVGDQANVTVRLYAEIISVESGTVKVINGEGTGGGATSSGEIQWSAINLNSASFASSAPGVALAAATESLARALQQSIAAPAVEDSFMATGGSAATTDQATSVETAAADSDEELQQLVAQAEEFVANGAGDPERLKSVNSALEKLKGALAAKAAQIEGGADPNAAGQGISSAKEELQTTLASATESVANSGANSAEAAPATGEKKSLLGAIDQHATEVLGLLQKIQEMRAAVRGAKEDPYQGNEASEGALLEAVEQPTEDVSGVVLEAGQPFGGVEVIDADSDTTAITAPDGSYTLKGLPAGKLSTLMLKKGGKQIGSGQIDLLRGRTSVADFEVTAKMSSKTSALRILPSAVVLSSKAKGTGTLKGIAKDKAGKPLPRALVIIPKLGVARTDSTGHYAFFNVPAGEHVVTIQRAGLKPVSTKVSVTPSGTTEAQSQLASALPKAAGDRQRAIVRGTGSTLHGRVLDGDGKALAGAKVLLLQSSSATSVLTSPGGDYEVKDLRPGTYTALVTKAGFENGKRTITAQMGKTESQDFRLQRQNSLSVAKALSAQSRRQPAREPARASLEPARSSAVPAGSSTIPLRPVASAAGELTGRVVDAATRKPIAGATVSIRGRSVKTSDLGTFSLGNLVPGDYQINLTSAGFAAEQTSVAIRAGVSNREEFALKRLVTVTVPNANRLPVTPATPVRVQLGQLQGRVIDAGTGAPVAGATCSISGGQSIATGRDGSFAIGTLAPGSYQVLVRKPGFAERRGEFRIRSGEVTTATFSLISVVRRSN